MKIYIEETISRASFNGKHFQAFIHHFFLQMKSREMNADFHFQMKR